MYMRLFDLELNFNCNYNKFISAYVLVVAYVVVYLCYWRCITLSKVTIFVGTIYFPMYKIFLKYI